MIKFHNILIFIFISILIYSFYPGDENKAKGVYLEGMDMKVNPGDDFYTYANGTWMNTREIPGTESVWGSFGELRESNQKKLKTILFDAAAQLNSAPGSNVKKVGDFFAAGMDSFKRNNDGLSYLKAELTMIDNITSSTELGQVIGELHSKRVSPIFYFYVDQDLKNSAEMVGGIYNAGLGLPDRDYYTRTDEEAVKLRKKYTEHLASIFTIIGYNPKQCAKTSQNIISMETELANVSWTNVERRNIKIQYNRITTDSLTKLCAYFNWNAYFSAIGMPNSQREVIVNNPKFMMKVSELTNVLPLETWKDYLKWNLVNTCGRYLTDDIYTLDFGFYEMTLKGVKRQTPRWKAVLEATDGALGDALGQIFVEKYFSADAKKKVNEMVDFLFAAYRERIKSRTWMGEETKKAALLKLDAIVRKLGYPDVWKDYTSMIIKRDSYVRNFLNANNYDFKRNVNKLGKPVSKTEWGMTPPTINAYYNSGMNEIVFPAGIMQYPFFDADMDMAVNFGAMGAVIGHELTHGFDDQGAQFDAQGNYIMWWKDEDYKQFEKRAQMVVQQFNAFVAIDTLRVNGSLTLGENIADLGGLTMAYYGLKLYMNKHPEMKDKKLDGFTPEQRYFLGWAKVWCVKHRPEALKQRLITDVHSPGRFRVNGPVSNMQEFYDAFGVKEGNKLWKKPEERAEIW